MSRFSFRAWTLITVALLLALSGCDVEQRCGGGCLAIAHMKNVKVVNNQGQPVTGLVTRTVHVESTYVIHEGRQNSFLEPGVYTATTCPPRVVVVH